VRRNRLCFRVLNSSQLESGALESSRTQIDDLLPPHIFHSEVRTDGFPQSSDHSQPRQPPLSRLEITHRSRFRSHRRSRHLPRPRLPPLGPYVGIGKYQMLSLRLDDHLRRIGLQSSLKSHQSKRWLRHHAVQLSCRKEAARLG